MNITDKIDELLNRGVQQLTFARDKEGRPLCVAQQVVRTTQGMSTMEHQCLGTSFADALENVTKGVTHCSDIQSKILRVN
jgi:hypothetical protein